MTGKSEKLFRSYSQFGQDILYATLLNQKKGIFVDVGARDGKFISNTLALEKHFGWEGVCIEPHPLLFAELESGRSSRNYNCAITHHATENPTMPFAVWQEGPIGHSGLTDVDYRHEDLLAQHKHEVVDIPVRTLTSVMEECGLSHVDLVDVDVEGAELSVIQSIDFSRFTINIISVERATAAIAQILASQDFRLLTRLGEDDVYISNDFASRVV